MANAQTLIPLDSRPATRVYPALVANLAGGQPSVPPAELLGRLTEPAKMPQLLAWLESQPKTGPLLVSLDALGYGGLVQSRNSDLSVAEVLARLEPLKTWKEKTGQEVYAFITLPRQPEATNRPRNLEMIKVMMQWAQEGKFKELDITWDDAIANSPAPAEGAALKAVAGANVRVYPGADEVLAMLTARALAPQPKTLKVVYSNPKKAEAVIKYEGISLIQSTLNHAEGTGFSIVPASFAAAPDLTLFVFNGGDARQSAVNISGLLRHGPVVVVDVEKVNLGNLRLWQDLKTLRQHANLKALAAWGTPGNNLGSALAHAKLAIEPQVNPIHQDAFLAREYANDVVYSTELRPQIRKEFKEADMNTPPAQAALLKLAQTYFPLRIGQNYTLQDADLPWGRSFEWNFDLQPQ